ncbi:hypothetical protein B0J13DRAFT_576125 [Dactylonectria estremocensis]|uniref:Uncharacterized protein n=1 Tax=Dactylonectria estremocensis TaxID=1079267 RepID=A0A9P9D472_9HYPO|nr:hypothetical protein B0J13DRAFT_576125 [Dactylonectria estremocensis]
MTVGGCTPLLELNSNTQENSNIGTTSTASTPKTNLESSSNSKPSTLETFLTSIHTKSPDASITTSLISINDTALLSLSSTRSSSSSLSDKSATPKPSSINQNSSPTSTTKRITNTKTTSTISSEVTVHCGKTGTGITTLDTLQKYAKKFCQNLDGAALSKNESLKYAHGNGELQHTFQVSWVSGCEAEEQSIIETGSLCSATLVKAWQDCDTVGGVVYTQGCLVWAYWLVELTTGCACGS